MVDVTAIEMAELARCGDADGIGRVLHLAGQEQSRLLVDRALDTGFTPLLLAAWHGRDAALTCLLSHGADANRRLPCGAGALYTAARNGHVAVLGTLLLAGCNPGFLRRIDKSSCLHTASKHGHAAALALLLSEPGLLAMLEAEDVDGSTPLLLACNGGHTEAVQALMEGGAAVTRGTSRRPSALLLAAHLGNLDVVSALLGDARPSPVVDLALPNGATALHMAAHSGHATVMRLLLKAGAGPGRMRSDGAGPSAVAKSAGHLALAAELAAAATAKDKVAIAKRRDRMSTLRRLQSMAALKDWVTSSYQ